MCVFMIRKNIKSLAKRSQMILKLYNWLLLFRSISLKYFLDIKNIKKIKLIFMVKTYTMLKCPRLSKLYEIVSCLKINKIQGNFVECGVRNGGSVSKITMVTKNNQNRKI